MKFSIKLIRKIKSSCIRLKLHILCKPCINGLTTAAWLLKLSRWAAETPMPECNDFYAKQHDYQKRYDLYEHVIKSERLSDIYYLEFGVARGHSITWWVNRIKSGKSRFAGFDTFSGLPEDWGHFKKGDMSAEDTLPDINDKRCRFIKGTFQETLPPFLKDFKTGLQKVIHLDADLYSSTLFTLTMLGPLLHRGDILIFDEFNVPLHEFKAFTDFINSYYVTVSVIGAVNNYYQVAFRVEENLSAGGNRSDQR